MSQRSQLEDKNTVVCLGCNAEWIESDKKPNQKYPKHCKNCGRTNVENQRLARKQKHKCQVCDKLIKKNKEYCNNCLAIHHMASYC